VHELFLLSTKNIAIGLFVIGLGLSLKILPQIVRKFIND
jgi:hypothetical protein